MAGRKEKEKEKEKAAAPAMGREEDRKALKEEKKQFKKEQKAQRKEARKRARELEAREEAMDEESGNSIPVLLVTMIIVIVWVGILGLLIKLDVGGFGSTVLRPVLQNVPLINKVLPSEKMLGGDKEKEDEYYGYKDLKEAVDQIKRLELELENSQNASSQAESRVKELEAEIERLRTFESNQIAFENIKNEFYDEVIYSDKGPGADAYIKYYESMNPATAENLYKQVIIQKQTDSEVKDYANAYSEMKPKEAAAIFEAMQDNLELAAKILGTMSADDRGKILGVMDSEVAARLTKIMDPER